MEQKNMEKQEAAKTASFDERNPMMLTLGDPFLFDGAEIKEINLEGLFDLTAGDMCDIDRQMIAKGYSGARMEVTRQYAMLVTAKVNHKPWEFCNGMKARDSIRLKEIVTTFFYITA